jgi:hypothetical protein
VHALGPLRSAADPVAPLYPHVERGQELGTPLLDWRAVRRTEMAQSASMSVRSAYRGEVTEADNISTWPLGVLLIRSFCDFVLAHKKNMT